MPTITESEWSRAQLNDLVWELSHDEAESRADRQTQPASPLIVDPDTGKITIRRYWVDEAAALDWIQWLETTCPPINRPVSVTIVS